MRKGLEIPSLLDGGAEDAVGWLTLPVGREVRDEVLSYQRKGSSRERLDTDAPVPAGSPDKLPVT